MQRVLIDSTARITEAFIDGLGASPTPPIDAASYSIVDAEGITTSSGTANPTANPSEFWVPLTTVDTAELDRLTITWANPSVGEMSTTVEVVGGFMFSIAELRAESTAFESTTNYPAAKLAELRTTVEQALEDATGVAFVPRYGTAPLNSDYTIYRTDLRRLRNSTTIVRNGKTLVGYEYGMDYPPARVKQAALILAKSWGLKGPIDSRTTSFTSPETGITSSFVTTGRFGIPEVDSVVDEYSGGTEGGIATVPMTAYTGPVWQ